MISPPVAPRDGVGASCVALPAGAWPMLLDFLVERFPRVAPADWAARMAARDVFDEAGQAVPPAHPYTAHRRIYYFRTPAPELPIPFEATVVYQDAHLVVADKPHFLPVTPSGRYLQETLLIRLKRQLGLNDLVPLHRIDRDTAGLVLFSVNPSSRAAYAALFRDRQVNKRYEAVAPWRADLTLPRDHHSRIVQSPSYMQMMEAPGLANARTQITLLAHDGRLGHYALCPVTGYRHQLRVQMASLGVPILNDGIYPVLTPECLQGVAPDYSQPLQLLAKTLGFVDPVSGAERRFTSTRHLKAAIYGL